MGGSNGTGEAGGVGISGAAGVSGGSAICAKTALGAAGSASDNAPSLVTVLNVICLPFLKTCLASPAASTTRDFAANECASPSAHHRANGAITACIDSPAN